MRIFLSLLLQALCAIAICQVPDQDGTFAIHKFQQEVGKEKYSITDSAGNKHYKIEYAYVDRGNPVKLDALLKISRNGRPVHYNIKGGTSRFTSTAESVLWNGKDYLLNVNDSSFSMPDRPHLFPVSGYAPAIVQQLLLQHWKRLGKPRFIDLLPTGRVEIIKDGVDSFFIHQKWHTLDRYVLAGIVWGNELMWVDRQGQLICLITNDAEGDKQEIVSDPYKSLLPRFLQKAAVHGMRLFKKNKAFNEQQPEVIAIKNGTLVDVVTADEIKNSTVIIRNGKISYAGPAANAVIPGGATIIDASDQYILPGLWDMHAHFQQAEWGPAYLAAGITSVRDCGNEFDYINAVADEINIGGGLGPSIFRAGIIDGKGPMSLGIVQAEEKEEAIAAVRRYKEYGYQQIKVYSSVKPAILRVICQEAQRLNLPVTGHLPNGMTIMQAIDSGMDMINHLQYVVKRNPANRLPDLTDSANLDLIAKKGIVVDPTISFYEMIFRPLQNDIRLIEPAFDELPPALQLLFARTGSADTAFIELGKKVMPAFKQLLMMLKERKIPIVAGSDMMFPGLSLLRELELYVETGFTPMEALQCATIVPARVMKMQAITGSIDPGKNADIILVKGNPLQNISDLRKISKLIKAGKIYDPVMLKQAAGFNN